MTKEEQIRAFCEDAVREGCFYKAAGLWEFKYTSPSCSVGWRTSLSIPAFDDPVFIYRRKPRTFRLGNVDVPWPLEVLPDQDYVHVPDMTVERHVRSYFTNTNDAARAVKQKIAHATGAAAHLHAQGLVSANRIALGLEVLEVG